MPCVHCDQPVVGNRFQCCQRHSDRQAGTANQVYRLLFHIEWNQQARICPCSHHLRSESGSRVGRQEGHLHMHQSHTECSQQGSKSLCCHMARLCWAGTQEYSLHKPKKSHTECNQQGNRCPPSCHPSCGQPVGTQVMHLRTHW
jgi:hypothetical protein